MIWVFTEGHDYRYEVADILANYCRRDKISFEKEKNPAQGEGVFVHSKLTVCRDCVEAKCGITGEGKSEFQEDRFEPAAGSAHEVRKQYKRYVKHNLLKAAERFSGKKLPWGILTGIRPVKMIHKLMDKGLGDEEILKILVGFYRLANEKARLGLDIALSERDYIIPYDPGKVSIYISIPFCPTRCSYCSFPSNQLPRWGHLTEGYMDCLAEEIERTGGALKERGLICDTVYIGGGTPTSLSLPQVDRLLNDTARNFLSTKTREFTVEAGRPDTLDKETLRTIKKHGVTRISINPQTMNAATLDVIGRKHSPEDIIRAFELARQTGHDNINMDLIIGLPGENADMVMHTLEYIGALKPEGVTVHTLAIKRASRLHEEAFDAALVEESEVERMMCQASGYLQRMGMKPYYLYRQKYMVGNLENIGFCLPGYEGIYNMQVMEEKQTVLGLGAGAVSKLVFLSGDRLERVENPKSLQHYMDRARDIAKNKKVAVARLE